MSKDSKKERLDHLNRRLAVHRRRLRYWANLPGIFGPTAKTMRRRAEMYDLAKDDAHSIAIEIHELTGEAPRVVDPLRTFQCRYGNPDAEEKLIYP